MDIYLRQRLGENIRNSRKAAGLSKARFCLMIGLSRPALDAIENGTQNVKLDTLNRIADGLGVEVWTLLR